MVANQCTKWISSTSNVFFLLKNMINNFKFTYLIKSNKLCSFSVTLFDGLAAISHSNFGKQASRKLLAKLIFSFKLIFFCFGIPSVVSID